MTIEETICKQIKFLRDCFDEYRTEAISYADAKSAFENAEAMAGNQIINNAACDDAGELLVLSNDISRKAYVKEHSLIAQTTLNRAREMRDVADKKVEIERSVLSVLKQFAEDQNFDRDVLSRYDI